MQKIRRHYVFSGLVQGVGFRYRAYHTAQLYRVTGWVKNLADGNVEMELEGSEQDIEKVLLSIESGSYIRIENFSVKDVPLEDDRDFEIR